MKKLLFLALGFAFIATSCSTKENQMSAADSDSTLVVTRSTSPASMDSTATMVADSASMDAMVIDSATAIPAKK